MGRLAGLDAMKGPIPKLGERHGHRPDPHPVVFAGRPLDEELMEPPADLPRDAKALWRQHVAPLAEIGVVDRCDRPALEALCVAYARAKQAGRVIAVDGVFSAGSMQQLRAHPAIKIEADAWQSYLRLAEHFGMTPVARVRLGLAELNRRSLAHELHDQLGALTLEPLPVDAQVVDDDDQAA